MGAQYNVYHLVNLQTNTDIGIPASSACVIKLQVTKKDYLRQKQESLVIALHIWYFISLKPFVHTK